MTLLPEVELKTHHRRLHSTLLVLHQQCGVYSYIVLYGISHIASAQPEDNANESHQKPSCPISRSDAILEALMLVSDTALPYLCQIASQARRSRDTTPGS